MAGLGQPALDDPRHSWIVLDEEYVHALSAGHPGHNGRAVMALRGILHSLIAPFQAASKVRPSPSITESGQRPRVGRPRAPGGRMADTTAAQEWPRCERCGGQVHCDLDEALTCLWCGETRYPTTGPGGAGPPRRTACGWIGRAVRVDRPARVAKAVRATPAKLSGDIRASTSRSLTRG